MEYLITWFSTDDCGRVSAHVEVNGKKHTCMVGWEGHEITEDRIHRCIASNITEPDRIKGQKTWLRTLIGRKGKL